MDRVVVFGADSGLMPHRLAENIEEERRVFHVAITRSRRETVVVAEAGNESPFVSEALGRSVRQWRRMWIPGWTTRLAASMS